MKTPIKVVSKSPPVSLQTVGKCLTQWQSTLTLDQPIENYDYKELTDSVRPHLPGYYPTVSSLKPVSRYEVSVVYVVDSSD